MSATLNCLKAIVRKVELAIKVRLREMNFPVINIAIDLHCVARVTIFMSYNWTTKTSEYLNQDKPT
jgi:hypothetical protein